MHAFFDLEHALSGQSPSTLQEAPEPEQVPAGARTGAGVTGASVGLLLGKGVTGEVVTGASVGLLLGGGVTGEGVTGASVGLFVGSGVGRMHLHTI